MKRVYLLVALVVVLTLVSGRPIQAKSEYSIYAPTIQPVVAEKSSLEKLTTEADLILIGRVTDTRSHWNTGVTSILTDVLVSVENVVKGDESLKQVTVEVEGGQVGDLTLSVSGSPHFQVDERAILFLKRRTGSTYSPVSWQYGVYVLSGDKVDTDTPVSGFIGQIRQIMTSHGIPIPSFGGSIGQGPGIASSPQTPPSTAQTSKANLAPAPVITGIIPSSGSAGANTQVIINGSNFGTSQGSGKVTFYYRAGQPRIEASVIFWNDTRIVATVPVGVISGYGATASSGQAMVSTINGDSNPYQFAVTFSYEGDKWSATSPVVHYRVNPNVNGVVSGEVAVQAGAQTWSGVSGADFHFVYDGPTVVLNPAFNGVNEVMWGDLGTDGPLATTTLWHDNSGNMLEFDLEFNSNDKWSTSGAAGTYDIQSITIHELGHALGFRDLYGNLGAPNDSGKVMYGFESAGQMKRSLTADDLTGLRWTYPVVPTLKLGEGGFGPEAIGVNPITNRIYVGDSRSNNVSVIDGTTNSVIATVNVGSGPQGIVVNPITNRIYLANSFGNSVSVIDGVSNGVIASINVGSFPFRLGVNPITNRIYVANSGGSNVSVIDGASNTVISTVSVGSGPSGVGVNPTTNLVYVSNDASNNVSVIDGESNTVVVTVSVGNGPGGLEVNPTTNHVYVANYGSNSVSVIDGGNNSVVTIPNTGDSPRGLAVNSNSNRIYVANSGGNSVSVIDGVTNSVVSTVEVGTEPFGIGVNATTNRVYVANYQNNSISVIDGAANSVAFTIKIGSGPDALGVNLTTNRVYVTNSGSNNIAVIDGATNSITSMLNVGSAPAGVGVNSTTNRIYVANSGNNTISVINGDSNNVITTVDVGNRPNGVVVNPSTNRIYVANNGSSSVSVIDGSNNSVVTTIEVGFLPIGIDVNPSTNRIYVANNYDNTVSIIDGSNNTVTATLNVGTWPFGLGVNPITNRIYVANNGSNSVSVIDGSTNNVVATAKVGVSPRGLGINTITNRIYVANNGNNTVSVIDGNTNIVMATQNVGKGPRSIGIYPNTNRIWVTNYWADNLSMITDTFGTAAKLAFTVQPSSPNSAGMNFGTQPVVVVQDSSGNVVTNSNAAVTLNITTSTGTNGAVLFGPPTISAVNGTVTFNGLSINLAGEGYTLTATSDTLTAAISVTLKVVHPGDSNGDGMVNMGDVTKVERVILGLDPPTPGCDANVDQNINMGDVTKIERIVLGFDPLIG